MDCRPGGALTLRVTTSYATWMTYYYFRYRTAMWDPKAQLPRGVGSSNHHQPSSTEGTESRRTRRKLEAAAARRGLKGNDYPLEQVGRSGTRAALG